MAASLQSLGKHRAASWPRADAAATRGRQRGLGLIEVLVATLVFSIGLIGLAGMLTTAAQAHRGAYVRTQAGFLAQAMAERMHANLAGVWSGGYDSGAYPVAGAPPDCASNPGCSPAQVARRDQLHWSRQLVQFLPAATAAVTCTPAAAGPAVATTQSIDRPPYSGTCSLTLTWVEHALVRGGVPAPQTFAAVFQP